MDRQYVVGLNAKILTQCREQMDLTLESVAEKVKDIAAAEAGICCLKNEHLDILRKLYSVPRWVFIAEELPEKYNFVKSIPFFKLILNKKKAAESILKINLYKSEVKELKCLIDGKEQKINNLWTEIYCLPQKKRIEA